MNPEPKGINVNLLGPKKETPSIRPFAIAVIIVALIGAAMPRPAHSAEGAVDVPPPPSRVNALLNFEFSDKYLTPRGMIVHDDGLTVQPLVLGFFNVYKGESFLNDFTLVGGVWNDFCTDGVSKNAPFGSRPKTHWVEIDPIAGISTKFAKNFQLDVTYTVFEMHILNIPTSQHLETKLSFDDTPYLKNFALHPYFLYWQPGRIITTLALAYPHCTPGQQKSICEYTRRELDDPATKGDDEKGIVRPDQADALLRDSNAILWVRPMS